MRLNSLLHIHITERGNVHKRRAQQKYKWVLQNLLFTEKDQMWFPKEVANNKAFPISPYLILFYLQFQTLKNRDYGQSSWPEAENSAACGSSGYTYMSESRIASQVCKNKIADPWNQEKLLWDRSKEVKHSDITSKLLDLQEQKFTCPKPVSFSIQEIQEGKRTPWRSYKKISSCWAGE